MSKDRGRNGPGAGEKGGGGPEGAVRCRRCGKLLGKVGPDGALEIRHGRLVIHAERACLRCPRCGRETEFKKRGCNLAGGRLD